MIEASKMNQHLFRTRVTTVDLEIFARILFSRIASKDILVM